MTWQTTWLARLARHGVHMFAARRFPWQGFLATLALGAAGGAVFEGIGVPLPWMLGSMVLVTIGALLRLPLTAPSTIRPPMTAIIGVMLGGGFSPELLGQLATWTLPLVGLIAYTIAAAALCVWYLVHVAGYDRDTAFFAGMPGGLVEMIELATERGADIRIVALTHGARILLIVLTVPLLVQFMDSGAAVPVAPIARAGMAETSVATLLGLGIAALVGVWVGERLHLPARHLLGPMLVSGAVHMTGLVRLAPPSELVQAAQLVIGTVLGARFVGTAPALIGRILAVSTGMTVILVLTTLASAMLVSRIGGQDFVTLVLSYTPGGLPEMSLLAMALGADVAFVATHHLVRVLAVMTGAGPVFALFPQRRQPVDTAAE